MFTKAQEHQLLHEVPDTQSSAYELRVVKSLLWDAIAANLNVSERDEVRLYECLQACALACAYALHMHAHTQVHVNTHT